MRRVGPLIALLGVLVSAPALGQTSEWPKTVYACHHSTNLEPFGGMLNFDTVFHPDGRIGWERVSYYSGEQLQSVVKPGEPIPPGQIFGPKPVGARGSITLDWPTAYSNQEGLIDWSAGTLRISLFNGETYQWRKDERWTVIMVLRDRDKDVHVYPVGLDLHLWPRGFGPKLQSEPAPQGTYGFTTPIDTLLAWGSGKDRLTVIETRVKPRKHQRNSFPNSPFGEMRVIAEYEVYPASIAAFAAAIRRQHEAWRAGIGDFTKSCRKQEMHDPSQEIVVT